MNNLNTQPHLTGKEKTFTPAAQAIVKRQYLQEGERTIQDMFHRVANWVAEAETEHATMHAEAFYNLMNTGRFSPGGRVLAGAGTSHGNGLNCFVQDGSPHEPGTTQSVLALAKKLALVTKVGGGNGLNLDPIPPKRLYSGPIGRAYITIKPDHPDHDKVQSGTFMDLVTGQYVTRPYDHLEFISHDEAPEVDLRIEVPDSVEGIWDAGAAMIEALLQDKTVLLDVSQLRKEGAPVRGSGGTSSGPSSFTVEILENFAKWARLGAAEHAGPVATLRYIYATSLKAIRQGGTRRGAGMATLSAHHPDVEDFITSKDLEREAEEGDISTFNISVLVTDEFMTNPDNAPLLRKIAKHAWKTGEPGMMFIDRINEHNPMLEKLGPIMSSNPCGEIALYPGEPCDLGAINLAQYVHNTNGQPEFNYEELTLDTHTAIRFLDNVLDVNNFALDENREMSHKLRRLGLGIMGLADTLIKLGVRYDTNEGRELTSRIIKTMHDAALEASEHLATERGAFPAFNDSSINTPRRNVAFLTVAPTGTTSMMMDASGGVEPVYAATYVRKIGTNYVTFIHPLLEEILKDLNPTKAPSKRFITETNEWDTNKLVTALQEHQGSIQPLLNDLPADSRLNAFITAHDIHWRDHVLMQSTIQNAFDAGDYAGNSISKTINLANEATVDDILSAYTLAFETRTKGITVYRDGSRTGQVLNTSKKDDTTTKTMTKTTDPETQAPAPAAQQAPTPTATKYERPQRMTGHTDRVELHSTSSGASRSFFITVNTNGDNQPREVFIISGKGGDEANGDSEALGRLTSIALQYGVPAEAIIKTLRGISGGMFGTYQDGIVTSKADIIASALEAALGHKIAPDTNPDDACPQCGGQLAPIEGCLTCTDPSCGWSRCS